MALMNETSRQPTGLHETCFSLCAACQDRGSRIDRECVFPFQRTILRSNIIYSINTLLPGTLQLTVQMIPL